MTNKLFNKLPADEQIAQEDIYTIGDSILFQFYNGNWSSTVETMIENFYTTADLIDYINVQEEGECPLGWYEWFDRAFFAELGASKVKFN